MNKSRLSLILTIASYWGSLILLIFGALEGYSKNQAYDTSEVYLTGFLVALPVIPAAQFFYSIVLKKQGDIESASGVQKGLIVNGGLLLLALLLIALVQ